MSERFWTISLPESAMEDLRRVCGLKERAVVELLAFHSPEGLPADFGNVNAPEPEPEPEPAPAPRSTENASAPPPEPESEDEDDSEG